MINFICCFIYCVLAKKVQYQKYLELIGSGGTGKSTLINLICALVGINNFITTDLVNLESNRFESANLKDKSLIVINDSPQYRGKASVLKSITGLDPIRYEMKYLNSDKKFKISGLIIIAANESISISDYTSGLMRRRITLFLDTQPIVKRHLITMDFVTGDVTGEFKDELSHFFHYCLTKSKNVDHYLTEPLKVPVLKQFFKRNLMNTNPIANFLLTYFS